MIVSDRVALAEKIVKGVWATFHKPVPIPSYHKTPTTPTAAPDTAPLFLGKNNPFGLNLISQFFHAPSCLHNEGVWHNCLMGINYVILSKKNNLVSDKCKDTYTKLSSSLYDLNFDEKEHLFRNRTYSSYWNHETSHCNYFYLLTKIVKHYNESTEKSLNSNAIAVIFWSFLTNDTRLDIEKMWIALETKFYDTEKKLWKRSSAEDRKYRAVDHAILLVAAHRTLNSSHFNITRERRTYLERLQTQLVDTILNTFNYANTDRISTYIIGEEHHTSKHHASYVPQENAQENSTIKIKRFAWQDVWVALALHTQKVDVQELTKNIYETFHDPISGALFNEPRQNKVASWGGKLCNFTGDNALFYLLLHKLGQNEHPFVNSFHNLLQELIVEKDELDTGDYCYIAEAKQFRSPSLWASSELTFSLLLSTGADEL